MFVELVLFCLPGGDLPLHAATTPVNNLCLACPNTGLTRFQRHETRQGSNEGISGIFRLAPVMDPVDLHAYGKRACKPPHVLGVFGIALNGRHDRTPPDPLTGRVPAQNLWYRAHP